MELDRNNNRKKKSTHQKSRNKIRMKRIKKKWIFSSDCEKKIKFLVDMYY